MVFLACAIKAIYLGGHFPFWSFHNRTKFEVRGPMSLKKALQSYLFFLPLYDLPRMEQDIITKQVSDTAGNKQLYLRYFSLQTPVPYTR